MSGNKLQTLNHGAFSFRISETRSANLSIKMLSHTWLIIAAELAQASVVSGLHIEKAKRAATDALLGNAKKDWSV
jgi:hypothetical protein